MNEYDPYHQHAANPPRWPVPWVTHQELAPMHTKIGSLEKGQESILQAFGGYRAEILTRMDRIERLIAERPVEEARGEVRLTWRELALIATALIVAGGFIGRIGFDSLLGG